MRATCRSIVWGGLLLLLLSSCEPPKTASSAASELPGVDTSFLTGQERAAWSELVDSQRAPCSGLALTLRACVEQNAPCPACRPAARLLATQVSRGRTSSQAEEAMKLRFAPDGKKTIDVEGSPVLGSPSAEVTIVEWADFQCPFCMQAAESLARAQSQRPEHVRLIYKQYPLASHPSSDLAARAAIAAGRQGKFWEMHEWLFAGNSNGLTETTLNRMVATLSLDATRFATDLASPETRARIERDRTEAERLGLHGTPFIFINGRHFDTQTFSLIDDLEGWIDLELELFGKGAAR
jgi:protein-disulfide isomerase